jgi:hypothetical protein
MHIEMLLGDDLGLGHTTLPTRGVRAETTLYLAFFRESSPWLELIYIYLLGPVFVADGAHATNTHRPA